MYIKDPSEDGYFGMGYGCEPWNQPEPEETYGYYVVDIDEYELEDEFYDYNEAEQYAMEHNEVYKIIGILYFNGEEYERQTVWMRGGDEDGCIFDG